jgi:hypothetical protein
VIAVQRVLIGGWVNADQKHGVSMDPPNAFVAPIAT